MNDDTSKKTGFGGNTAGNGMNGMNGTNEGKANSFNTNGTNSNAFSQPSNLPNNLPGASNSSELDLNPKFSGMPTSTPQPSHPAPQSAPQPAYVPPKPVFAPQPSAPAPAQATFSSQPVPLTPLAPSAPLEPVAPSVSATLAAPSQQFSRPPLPQPKPQPQSQFQPQAPMPGSMPSSMQSSVQSSNSYIKAQEVHKQQNNSGSRGILGIIIFFVIVVLAVVAFWFFAPADFSFSKYLKLSNITEMMKGNGEEGTIEERVANPAEQPAAAQNSIFPTGVINSGNTTGTAGAKPAAVKPVTKTSNTYSMSDQDKISAYISANINKIAKTTGYVVTDVTFDGPSRAIVTYSRGSTVRSAVVNVSIDSSGNVRVTGFTSLTK